MKKRGCLFATSLILMIMLAPFNYSKTPVPVAPAAQDVSLKNVQPVLRPIAGARRELAEIDFAFSPGAALDPAFITEDLLPGNVTVTVDGSNTLNGNPITPTLIGPRGFGEFKISFPTGLTLSPAALAGDVNFCFKTLHFIIGGNKVVKTDLCGTGKFITEETVEELYNQALGVLESTPKTSEEKNIFASAFAANGNSGDTEGGAELNLNSNDLGIPGLIASAHLNKTTAENADPRYFDAGLTYRKTFIRDRKEVVAIKAKIDQLNKNPNASNASEIKSELKKMINDRQRLAGAYLLDIGTKIEGEALEFRVTNFIFDGAFQFQSATYRLFGSRKGWLKFRGLAGAEVGPNMGKPEADMGMTMEEAQQVEDVDYAARFKAGGSLTMFYQPEETDRFFLKRFEFDMRFVNRYLFKREIMFDEETMENVETTKGNKHWFQTNAKFFLANSDSGRFGFKVTYNHGSLPPVFAKTNSFQFGLIFETADDARAR